MFIETPAVPQSEITRLVRERDAAQATIDRLTRENVGHGSIVVAGARLISAIDGIRSSFATDPANLARRIQTVFNGIRAAQGAVDGYNNAIAGTPHPGFTFPVPDILTAEIAYDRALAAARLQVTTAVNAEQLAIATNQATITSQRIIVTARQELIDRYRSDPTP